MVEFFRTFHFDQQPILNAVIKDLQEEIIFRIHNKNLSGIRLKMIPGVMNCAMSFFEKNSSPKDCTRLKNEAKKAAVFEGFFNFLSFAILPGNKALKPSGFCILNSLSFFEKPTAFLEQHNAIHLKPLLMLRVQIKNIVMKVALQKL